MNRETSVSFPSGVISCVFLRNDIITVSYEKTDDGRETENYIK